MYTSPANYDSTLKLIRNIIIVAVSYTHLDVYKRQQIGEHEYVLSARLEIEKVNETFNLELPESDE